MPESESKALKLLPRWIDQDAKPMTFRALSRELGVHVLEAQRILESYASSHPDLTRTYLLSGVPLANPAMSAKEEGEEDDKMDVDHPSTGDSEVYKPPAETLEGRQAARSVVVLCKSDQIEARKKQFDPSSLSTHIYSLSPPSSLPTPSSLVQPFFALLSHKAYLSPNLYGSKSNGSIVVLKGGEARLKAGQVDKPKSSVEVSKVAGKGKKDDVAPTAQGKKIGTLDWSKATLKKPVPPPPPLPAPASAEKKRSTSTSSSKPRAILSESEEEDSSDLTSAREKAKGPPMVARPSAPVVQKPVKEKKDVVQATSKEEKERLEQQKKELEGLWDMDVDEDEFSGKSKGKRKALESDDDDEISEQVPKPANKTAAPKPAAKAKPKPKNAASSSTTEDKAASEKEAVRNAEGKVRKTRRVVRSEMVMNKRGYMETEDVSEVESYYSDSDSTPAASAAAAPIKKPTAAPAPSRASSSSSTTTTTTAAVKKAAPAKKSVTAGKGGQTSMKSFFTKK